MSNATIGSFTAGEWNAIKSDARRYEALVGEYGSLKAAREKGGVDTKTTKSGLSLSNAHNTVKVMTGQRQYKSNISKKSGLHLEGKKTQYNRLTTMSVKMGKGSTVRNTQAAGGAKAIKNIKASTTRPLRDQQKGSKALQKSGVYAKSSGSKSGSSNTGRGSGSSGSKSGTGRSTGLYKNNPKSLSGKAKANREKQQKKAKRDKKKKNSKRRFGR